MCSDRADLPRWYLCTGTPESNFVIGHARNNMYANLSHAWYGYTSNFGSSEEEVLFNSPLYSVFTVESGEWSQNPDDDDNPHIIHLRAAVDNRKQRERICGGHLGTELAACDVN